MCLYAYFRFLLLFCFFSRVLNTLFVYYNTPDVDLNKRGEEKVCGSILFRMLVVCFGVICFSFFALNRLFFFSLGFCLENFFCCL